MKFVITGGAGFIGSHIAKHLVEKNHDVIIIDNLSRGRLENLSKIKEQIEFKKMDIQQKIEISKNSYIAGYLDNQSKIDDSMNFPDDYINELYGEQDAGGESC